MPDRRALVLVRLSRMTDATTSPERQEEDVRRYCTAHSLKIAGVARDTDVSGSVDPLARPELGPWLQHRLDEFDVVVASKLDRVGRNAGHIHALMDYLKAQGKSLATADGNIDIGSPMGRMILFVMASVAEMELEAISQRNAGAAQHNIRAGKYRGGITPVGYRAVKDDAGDWRLTPDEEGTAPAIREIVRRVREGDRLSAIVQSLNEREVPTHRDRQAELRGRNSIGRRWTLSNIRRILTSPALLGYVVTGEDQQVLYDDDGEPVSRTDEPVVSPADYYAVRAILDERRESAPKQKKSAESPLLTRVLYCARCKSPMYRLTPNNGRKARYRCDSTRSGSACGNGSVTCESAEEFATEAVFSALGNVPYVRREYVSGTDHSARIADIDTRQSGYVQMMEVLTPDTAPFNEARDKMRNLAAQRDRLSAEPVSESGYKYVPTGETFDEHWESLSSARRNDFLRDHGIVVWAEKSAQDEPIYSVELADVLGMVEAVYPDHVADIRQRIADLREEAANDAETSWLPDPDDPATILGLIERQPSSSDPGEHSARDD